MLVYIVCAYNYYSLVSVCFRHMRIPKCALLVCVYTQCDVFYVRKLVYIVGCRCLKGQTLIRGSVDVAGAAFITWCLIMARSVQVYAFGYAERTFCSH
jgi:hypothetical protein